MKTIIYTSFPCVIKVDGQQEELNQNENLLIEEFDKILVYPLEKGRISFEIDFAKQDNNFYRVIERGNKRLVFLLDGLYAENAEIGEFEYKGLKSKVEIYPQKVVFFNQNSKKIIHLSANYSSFKYGNKKYIDYCLLKNFNGESSLIAYNIKKNTARVFSADEIEETDNGFLLTSSPFGYDRVNQEFYIDEEGLKIKQRDFVEIASKSFANETLPYQFLSAIKVGDYQRCLKMLSAELGNRLSTDSLKEYFGSISYFYMISPYCAYAISNDKNIVYEFQLKDNKISEISSE